jgi:CheY-like chemotaxis protein
MGKVSQILRNFVSNALKFTEQGEVRLSTHLSSSGQRIEFSVRDTGIGIAPENHAAVFDEFVQIENPIQTRHKGTGLGLPLSKRLAQLLGGEVSLVSAIGEGSTFTLSIPPDIDDPSIVFEMRETTPEVPPAANNNLRILVIDDEEAFRYVIRHSATEAHCATIEASDGFSGLALLRQKLPDLVFLDLQMPVMDGYKVLEEIKGDPALSQIPVVICTSSSPDLLDNDKLMAASMVLPKSALSRDAVARVLSQLQLGLSPE